MRNPSNKQLNHYFKQSCIIPGKRCVWKEHTPHRPFSEENNHNERDLS